MALEQNIQEGNFNGANNQGVSLRVCPPLARPFCRIWEGSRNLFCSGVLLKGSAVAVGLWNPKKGLRSVAMAFVFLLELFFVLNSFYHAFVCRPLDTPLSSWFCGNSSSNSSSLRPSSPKGALQGIELRHVLELVANFSVLMSNVAFFWCMWKLGDRSVYCVTMDKAYRAAKRFNWVMQNCTMLIFGILLLIQLFWLNLSFEEKGSLDYRVGVSLSVIPMWATLTNSWLFALITNAMKDCVSSCHEQIRNATQCSTDDIIRIHKHLCKQLSSTSEALKIWFVVHWFFLAIFVVVFVAEMVSLFKSVSDWFLFYELALWTFISLYIFVYPNHCASSVTVRCNKMLQDLNMTTDDEWQTGHPFFQRSELALFLQYAQFTNCGFKVGDLTFSSSFAWISTLIAICGLAIKLH
ncbi:hypothetical protein P5673_028473 [Acropora cervicornis]|uniref:Uncharacterized protein n=1 Tax=Acropora cervicornis TaxID=6130 RepID=A0AAD9PXB5_ACRCE|nr:hypothetical protein P5673_028473 [Acropora cervicornis]